VAVRQSMNFLAGLLVLLMGEENAYWTLVRSACSLCGTAALFSSLVLNIAVTVSLPVDVRWTSCTTTRDATDANSTAALVYMRCVNGQGCAARGCDGCEHGTCHATCCRVRFLSGTAVRVARRRRPSRSADRAVVHRAGSVGAAHCLYATGLYAAA
jgi:hypothetical protein